VWKKRKKRKEEEEGGREEKEGGQAAARDEQTPRDEKRPSQARMVFAGGPHRRGPLWIIVVDNYTIIYNNTPYNNAILYKI
jgi:hypothetical protein